MANFDLVAADGSAIGTGGDDIFYTPGAYGGRFVDYDWRHFTLNGGAGRDTLGIWSSENVDLRKFGSFSGIEQIWFDDYGGDLTLSSQYLTGIDYISGGQYQARINLAGAPLQTFDLQNKLLDYNYIFRVSSDAGYPAYSDIVINSKDVLLGGSDVHLQLDERAGMRIHLVGDTFTAAERALLAHQGAVYIWDDSDNGTANAAPVSTGLNRDHVATTGAEWAYIDAGQNASFSDDGRIRKISVSVVNGNGNDWVDIDYFSSVEVPGGLVEGAPLRDKNSTSGKVLGNVYHLTNSSFDILFNGDATPDFINRVVHSLIYQNTGTGTGTREIQITAWDAADKKTTSTVSVAHSVTVAVQPNQPSYGSDEPNLITGGSARDTIYGGDGDDTIYGGAGSDTLKGEAGNDTFVFDTRPSARNVDRILDFSSKDDSLWLDNKIFKKLGKAGSFDHPVQIKQAYFKVGDHAKDGNDYIIYNKKTGALYYDDDGSGSHAQVKVATLTKHPTLTFHDIFVV